MLHEIEILETRRIAEPAQAAPDARDRRAVDSARMKSTFKPKEFT